MRYPLAWACPYRWGTKKKQSIQVTSRRWCCLKRFSKWRIQNEQVFGWSVFHLTTRRNEKWFSGKSTSTKKDDVDGQGFKKMVYSQRVGAINSKKKTPKTRKRTSREHPEVTGVPFRHVAYVAAAAMFAAVPEPVASIHGACCDSQESGWSKNSANRHYHLESGSFHKHFTNPKKLLENLDLKSILGNVFLPVGSSGFVSPNLATHELPSYLWLSLWPVHSASLAVRRRRGGLGEGWEGLDLAMTHWGKSFFNESTWLFSKQKWK